MTEKKHPTLYDISLVVLGSFILTICAGLVVNAFSGKASNGPSGSTPSSPSGNEPSTQVPSPVSHKNGKSLATSSPSPSPIIVAPPMLPIFLSAAQLADTNAAEVGTGDIDIDKQDYPNSVWMCSDLELIANINCDNSSSPYWADYNVPAGYNYLSTTIGFSNDSPSDCDVVVQVFGDDTQLYNQEIYYGDSIPVTYQVSSYLRIRLQITPKVGMVCNIVFGNAEFTT
jgi:hypothetical protein